MNCNGCYFCRDECIKGLSEEEMEEAEQMQECPYFLDYWARERNPYESDE